MFPTSVLHGIGYLAHLPLGFTANVLNPIGVYSIWPRGSIRPFGPALIIIGPVVDINQAQYLSDVYSRFEDPSVSGPYLNSLGYYDIEAVVPLQKVELSGILALVRELNVVTVHGQPVHLWTMLFVGLQSTIQVIIGINSHALGNFMGVCTEFLRGIQLLGAPPLDVELVDNDNSMEPYSNSQFLPGSNLAKEAVPAMDEHLPPIESTKGAVIQIFTGPVHMGDDERTTISDSTFSGNTGSIGAESHGNITNSESR